MKRLQKFLFATALVLTLSVVFGINLTAHADTYVVPDGLFYVERYEPTENQTDNIDQSALDSLFAELENVVDTEATFIGLETVIDNQVPTSEVTSLNITIGTVTVVEETKPVVEKPIIKAEKKQEAPVAVKPVAKKEVKVLEKEPKVVQQVEKPVVVAERTSTAKVNVPAKKTVKETEVLSNKPVDKARLRQTLQKVAPNLVGIEDAVIEVYHNTGIKPSFQIAKFCLESNYGKSNLAVKKNNIAGWNAYPSKGRSVFQNATTFATKADCVRTVGNSLHKNYISQGRTTVYSIATKYCPPNSNGWTSSVKALMTKVDNTYNAI